MSRSGCISGRGPSSARSPSCPLMCICVLYFPVGQKKLLRQVVATRVHAPVGNNAFPRPNLRTAVSLLLLLLLLPLLLLFLLGGRPFRRRRILILLLNLNCCVLFLFRLLEHLLEVSKPLLLRQEHSTRVCQLPAASRDDGSVGWRRQHEGYVYIIKESHLVVRLHLLLYVKPNCSEPKSTADQQKMPVEAAHPTYGFSRKRKERERERKHSCSRERSLVVLRGAKRTRESTQELFRCLGARARSGGSRAHDTVVD